MRGSFNCCGEVNRRAFRLHVGEPVWLGPAVATKKKESVEKHELTLAQLLRQVDKHVGCAKMGV